MGSLVLKKLSKDLNEISMTPIKIPISKDISLFKNYRRNIANHALNSLNENLDNVGDVQFLKMNTYSQSSKEDDLQECLDILTDTEKELRKNFKRVVTLGKGSKPVPILFP
ncbi:hypothetical protein WA026_022906 [Henosepilachna vigintioctopunctata]|uniref:Uncharacterized protein n=1 Tax=Henosepilachna vigintioctopunctata TaxID=420089 RepID=A0AAW1U280_9CUCU